jgi:hypothetical protein
MFTCFYTTFHMPVCSGSLVGTIILIAGYIFNVAAMTIMPVLVMVGNLKCTKME